MPEVIAPARSQAKNVAVSAICAISGVRLSIVPCAIPASIASTSTSDGSMPATLAIFSALSVPCTPAVWMPTTRIPRGPSSAAR